MEWQKGEDQAQSVILVNPNEKGRQTEGDEVDKWRPLTDLNRLTSHSTALSEGFNSSLLPTTCKNSSRTTSSC